MTKKDYLLLAGSVVRTVRITEWTEKNQVKKQAKLQAISLVAHDLAGNLYGENKKFDRDKFLEACGVEFQRDN